MAYNLGFISDRDLLSHMGETLSRLKRKMNLIQFERNIIDPIKLLIEIHAYNRTPEQSVENEIARQLGKTLENAVGWFHQYIFRYIDGWMVPQDGVDVINTQNTIFAEIKNKYNTMNSSSASTVFSKLKGIVIGNPHAITYLVEVIAKKSQDEEWHISGVCLQPEKARRIRRISIDRFYALATGDENAFFKLCKILGSVIDDVQENNQSMRFENTVLEEMCQRNPDLMKSIFLSSFSTYTGFSTLHENK